MKPMVIFVLFVQGQALQMASIYTTFADSSIGSALGAFKLEMDPLIAFDAFMTYPQYDYEYAVNVDNITINVGGTWVFGQYFHSFIAPYTGIYYLAVGVGASPYFSMGISLLVFPAKEVRHVINCSFFDASKTY